MPRIPDDELARLKQAIRLDRLAALRGLTLERAGVDAVKALCCFHAEQTLSTNPNLYEVSEPEPLRGRVMS